MNMTECKNDCKYFEIDQGKYPCNDCIRLEESKDHYEKKTN